jgi:hypothetical protein
MSPHPPRFLFLALMLTSCHEDAPFGLRDAGADAATDAAGTKQTAIAPAQACPATPPPKMCVFGSERCGGGACIPLNTDQNCGRCGRTCGDSLCQGSECEQVLVPGSAGRAAVVAVNDAAVFWATPDGAIMKRTFADNAIKPLGADEGTVVGMVADDRFLYFMNKDGKSCPLGGCLWRLALDLSSRQQIADLGTRPGGLAMDADYIYWFDAGTISRSSKASGAKVEPLFQMQATAVGIALDEQFIYWGTDDGGEGMIKRGPKGGGTATPVARGLKTPSGVTVDGVNVYWADGGTHSIQMAPKQGGGPVTTLAMHMNALQVPVAVAVSDYDVYWTLAGGNIGFYKVPRCGGDVRVLNSTASGNIVVAKGLVYWSSDGGVFRIAQ